jgi:hypothetical protein
MSGMNASFNYTVPFNPAFVAINMGEKISHAVAPEFKKIKATGVFNFVNAKMNITIQSISDSAFIRVEHNYTAPDGFKGCCHPYRLSPNRYWKVDGILPVTFKAKASISYDGRTAAFSSNYWLDNNLINTFEDSLVLLYRRNAADDWKLYPYYTKNMAGNNNDKHGVITIDTLHLGEYVFAMKDFTLGMQNKPITNEFPEIKAFPNPAKDLLAIDFVASAIKISNNAILIITDTSGKIIYKEKLNPLQTTVNIRTSAYSTGLYFITINVKDAVIAKSKFMVTR